MGEADAAEGKPGKPAKGLAAGRQLLLNTRVPLTPLHTPILGSALSFVISCLRFYF